MFKTALLFLKKAVITVIKVANIKAASNEENKISLCPKIN